MKTLVAAAEPEPPNNHMTYEISYGGSQTTTGGVSWAFGTSTFYSAWTGSATVSTSVTWFRPE